MKYLISCLLLANLAFGVEWQRKYGGVLDGEALPGLYSGGFERSKPTFYDINQDGTLDMFIGCWDGTLTYYENTGTTTVPHFEFVSDSFQGITVRGGMTRGYSAPFFVDIDGDGDADLFSGDYLGKLHFYRNTGSATNPVFTLVDTFYNNIFARHTCPCFYDMDNDGDFDMFVGKEDGHVFFYKNIGNSANAVWQGDSTSWYNSDAAHAQASPVFCDIDNDKDFDMFVGWITGRIRYFRNDGNVADTKWVFVTDSFCNISVANRAGPTFADIDGDNLPDLFVGAKDGGMRYYKNVTGDSFEFITDNFLYLDFGGFSCPTFADVDSDRNLDMFVGTEDGTIKKLGNAGKHNWTYETRTYGDTIDVGEFSAPVFVDINDDGKLELFIGCGDGSIAWYSNSGTGTSPEWDLIGNNFNGINVGEHAKPTFCDIDGDGVFDLFVGSGNGKIWFYRNKGSAILHDFELVDSNYNSIQIARSSPCFGDIDDDGDFDMLVGCSDAYLYFYENTGDSASPVWAEVDSMYKGMFVGRFSTPALGDIDNDGDVDLLVGEADGGVNFWENLKYGIEENSKSSIQYPVSSIQIYPNPFTHSTEIRIQKTEDRNKSDICHLTSDLCIYDLSGRLIREFPPVSGGAQFSISLDVPGIYFCKVKSGDRVIIRKLVCIK